MQLQMITISSVNKEIYEKLVSELSKENLKGKPKVLCDDEVSLYKYSTLVVATSEELKVLNHKLNKLKEELEC
ncbi:MAG: hypothetical protein ACRC51_05835 [Cetobacterium sp.]